MIYVVVFSEFFHRQICQLNVSTMIVLALYLFLREIFLCTPFIYSWLT